MNYDQINKAHINEGLALTYRQSDDQFLKARQAEPIGTIKTMGGREVIKTKDGWRAHTKHSAARTQEHLKLNPSANIPDHKLKDHALNTPEKDLARVKKESTDPKLRTHAHEELQRRKDSEQKIQYSSSHGDLKYSNVDLARSAHEKSGKDKNGTGNSIVQHGNDFIVTTHDRAKRYMKDHDAKDVTFDKKKEGQVKSSIPGRDDATHLAKIEKDDKSKTTKIPEKDPNFDYDKGELKKKKLDLQSDSPYKKGQKVSYEAEDTLGNKWNEDTKVFGHHPINGHVLLENGSTMHHTELQHKEHRAKTNK